MSSALALRRDREAAINSVIVQSKMRALPSGVAGRSSMEAASLGSKKIRKYETDMRIVPICSSGTDLGSFWFLKMMRENLPFGGTFNEDCSL